ncbi:ATP-grasp domain-containing protein [Bradyrhizobium sp. KBS0727]|uniref:acetyl/propionyl/methylcrotonyl-CoA carboxylase subunit alpha n=1 Tax=unclassified Bradyrhizobium TaxID=2631580 RepID=UPI00110F6420|nr:MULTISPECIES: biotin carboxylase N-terminal domain-containing protein [unclassified Bradyrhizobium]QDW37245.1 ATP-grasp domain-containing protein [Bradyrhizobium sp. KBS0725]QDW43848.1 ATP-grasp domain-containing protein [Bradyrhizobium sp. KBS0727]
MFRKILIANRGEIACRIARTCQRLGVAVSGVHSVADRSALHVRTIGESVEIGGAAASESYLRMDAVIEAAKATGAEAIHPGFGFLAENAAFARAAEAAGMVFIGPAPETIERLGDKASAKQEAIAAGVPTVPGSQVPSEDAAEIERIVRRLKLPVMLKAAAGGGGKGMRAISSFDGLRDEIESAKREARNAFGHGGLIVEKLVERGRHIEVQIAGDGKGHVVHLFERECSLQRRHQKLIEEAPAANLPDVLRDRILADAVRIGERLHYRGVGTVEFIVSGSDYYFLEVNPRLQVEHPVTEMITGIDIVETMLRIASGEGLRFTQGEVSTSGHAVEARICAEDPDNNFMPSTGHLPYVSFPAADIRVETGIESGSEVTPYYDSMLAKLIAYADTRDEALDKLSRALDETSIFGIVTNQDFLKRLIALPATRKATFHTRLIDEQLSGLVEKPVSVDAGVLAFGAYYWMMRQRQPASPDPWRSRQITGWRMDAGDAGLSPIPILHLESAGASAEIRFGPLKSDGSMLIGVNDEQVPVKLVALQDQNFTAIAGSRIETVRIHQDDQTIFLHDRRRAHTLTAIPYLTYISATAEVSGELRAPMTGLISKVNVAVGDPIKAGEVAVAMESMKMELRIASEMDGFVTAVYFQPGDTVERNVVVAIVEPERPS